MDSPSDKYFKYDGVFWIIQRAMRQHSVSPYWQVKGPYCPKCGVQLERNNMADNVYSCRNEMCEATTFPQKLGLDETKRIIVLVFEAKLRESYTVIALDSPIGRVIDRAEDENNWVEARLGQRNGKLTGLLYYGDRKKGKDAKAQGFIDMEDEQIRFHATDAKPTDVICKVIVEFPSSKTTIEKK